MSARLLWEGADSALWARKLDGRTKVCLLAAATVLVITIDRPATLFALFTLALCLHVAAGTPASKWEVLGALLLICLWGAVASQGLFYAQTPRTPLVCFVSPAFPVLGPLTGGVFLYREGLAYGALQGMRSATMLCLGLFVCWTSDPRALLNAFVSWRMPPMAAFMAVTALRFLPVLAAEGEEIMMAARLRKRAAGVPFRAWHWLAFLPKLVYPLLARSLRRAQTLSLSVLSRGFVNYRPAVQQQWPWPEKLFSCLLLAAALLAVLMKLFYALAEQSLFYWSSGRPIYDFARLWL